MSSSHLQQTLHIIDEVDRLRMEKAQEVDPFDQKTLLEDVKSFYSQQGIAVDDEVVKNAIAAREQKMLELREPSAMAQKILRFIEHRKLIEGDRTSPTPWDKVSSEIMVSIDTNLTCLLSME